MAAAANGCAHGEDASRCSILENSYYNSVFNLYSAFKYDTNIVIIVMI